MGPPRLFLDELEVTNEMSKKSMAMLIYLIFAPDQCVTRERMIHLLWSDSDEKAARYNLRHNLWKLRRLLRKLDFNMDVIESDNQYIRLINDSVFEVDVFDLINLHKKGIENNWNLNDDEIDCVLKIYNNHFFEDFYLSDCEDFNDWLYFKREEFQKVIIMTLEKLAFQYEKDGRSTLVIELYKELSKYMPYDDHVHVHLIKNLKLIGDHFNALRYYEKHKKQLRSDLNIAPSDELQTLVKETIDHSEVFQNLSDRRTKESNHLLITSDGFESLEYIVLSSFIDVIIDSIEEGKLNQFDPYYWSDLGRVNGSIRKVINLKDIRNEFLTESTEKIRVFKAMYYLLLYLHTECNVTIEFEKNLRMDSYSMEFFENFFKTDSGIMMKNWL